MMCTDQVTGPQTFNLHAATLFIVLYLMFPDHHKVAFECSPEICNFKSFVLPCFYFLRLHKILLAFVKM